MKAYNGFKAQEQSGSREKLPAGGYVCSIINAKVEEYKDKSGNAFEVLILAIDVCEGDYSGFWKKDYDGNTADDKKWRGTFRINCPRDDGTEKDGWTKNTFNNFVWAIEESNPGYQWAWDEKTLKGKKLGVIYRDKEWEYNGYTGWTTEAGGATSIEKIRNQTFKALKPKPLKNSSSGSTGAVNNSPYTEATDDPEDLPF